MDLADLYIPTRKVKVRQSDPPWLNSRLKKLRVIRKRKHLYDNSKELIKIQILKLNNLEIELYMIKKIETI